MLRRIREAHVGQRQSVVSVCRLQVRSKMHICRKIAGVSPGDLFVKTPLSRREIAVVAVFAVLLLVALFAPAVAQPGEYHAFADQRRWLAVPNMLNVLSNIPFAIGGVWGLWVLLRTPPQALAQAERGMAALFFAGLVLTSLCSGWYHWFPNNNGLALDRLGMAVAFAGLLGLAAADRLGARAGWAVGVAVLVLGPLSVAVWAVSGNVLPWALVQFGGMLLVVGLLFCQPVPGAMGVPIGLVIALYALSKLFEHFDPQVYALTAGVVSGHSLKHLVASLAAWPVVVALHRVRAAMPHASPSTS